MDTNTNNQPVTISTDPPVYPASDFRFLRSEGLKWIQKLASTSWTDHNTHDPGITILDLLCYAITDLSNRLDYDMKDLLAVETGNAYESLYSPAQVLTVNPVTLLDFRKILLDIEGVNNAWIEKQTEADVKLYYFADENELRLTDNSNKSQLLTIKGIYNVSLDLESGSTNIAVTDRLNGSRNLCEDYNKITALSYQYLAVSGIIEIGQTDDINKTAAGILFRIASFISPTVNFYTLTEMLAKGKAIDEIFEGPALAHGFIDDDELSSTDLKTELHTSDIIREIMDEPGVLRVSNVSININEPSSSATAVQNWFLQLDTTKVPLLDVEERNGTWLTDKLIFRKYGATLTTDADKVRTFFNDLMAAQSNPSLSIQERDIVPAQGEYYPISDYYSIQNHFPQVYGISETGLPELASPLRKAQAKQLKAYLLFFEQILANYFSQAGHLKDLFSFSNTNVNTYFYQSLQNIVPGAEDILTNGSDNRIAGYVESFNDALQRKNRFFDHMIASFGESLSEYTLQTQSYEQWKNLINSSTSAANAATTNVLEKLVSDKLRFLSNYPLISNDRGKAFNYKEKSWDTDNVSGLEKRIAAKIGIENFNRHNLNDSDEEGFHLLEHILLRPVQEDSDAITPYLVTKPIDSFQDAGNNNVICNSKEHGLFTGDQIMISQSDVYTNQIYTITYLSLDSFQISTAYQKTTSGTAQWTRVINAKYLAFDVSNKSITAFAKDINDQNVICTSPDHGLAVGTNIEINGTVYFDGLNNVVGIVSKDSFKINQPATEPSTYEGITGTWTRIVQPDFYSLQLTCMFPAWTKRFVNYDFRTFIENTVGKETPVHITVYICWLNSDQMLQFEKPFQSFLNEIQEGQTSDITDVLKRRKIKWRAYRNSLIDLLPIGINTYPLADIPVVFPDNNTRLIIQYNEPAIITLMYSQPDVSYRVWDETGTLMNNSQNDEDNKGNDRQLPITTIPLTRDNYIFSIEAVNPVTKLSVRLFQTVLTIVGINTGLTVTAKESLVDYSTPVIITINNTQSGTIYQLVDAKDNTKILSDAVNSGSGGNLDISTKVPFYEDTTIAISATNMHTNDSAFLVAKPEIQVYPNTALEIAPEVPQVAEYNGELAVIIKNTQQSTSYYLRFEDIDDDTVNKDVLKGTMIGDIVPGNNGTIRMPVKNLTEDLTVSITARKNVSKIEKVLPGTIFIPVKPDIKKALSIVEQNIKAGDTATLKVSNTQRGIMYQLRRVNGNNSFTNIGMPGYHHKNYGVGKARIEIEFAIDTFTGVDVLLPAGVIKQTTTFNVLAIKATTKQQAEIGNITIEPLK